MKNVLVVEDEDSLRFLYKQELSLHASKNVGQIWSAFSCHLYLGFDICVTHRL